MSATICGHDRETLRWALGECRNRLDCDSPTGIVLLLHAWRDSSAPRYNALGAVTDPAKLAAIMAAEGQRLGVAIAIVAYGNSKPLTWELGGDGGWISMSQARAIVLQWLTMPKDTPIADVLKALEAP